MGMSATQEKRDLGILNDTSKTLNTKQMMISFKTIVYHILDNN